MLAGISTNPPSVPQLQSVRLFYHGELLPTRFGVSARCSPLMSSICPITIRRARSCKVANNSALCTLSKRVSANASNAKVCSTSPANNAAASPQAIWVVRFTYGASHHRPYSASHHAPVNNRVSIQRRASPV